MADNSNNSKVLNLGCLKTFKKNLAKGNASKGIYFDSNGTPQEMTYSVGKSVPANAVFTDTVYTFTQTENSLGIYNGNELVASYTPTLTKGDTGPTGATGPQGPQGVGISSIEKTSVNGLVDTYTLTYTDNTTSTFTVTNGSDGQNGNDAQVTAANVKTALGVVGTTTGKYLKDDGTWDTPASDTSYLDLTAVNSGAYGTSAERMTLQPTRFYEMGTMSSIYVTLAAPTSNIQQVYSFSFDSGSTATTLDVAVPSGSSIEWSGGISTIESNKHYEVNIRYAQGVNKFYALIVKW